jgi:hypothetical protein
MYGFVSNFHFRPIMGCRYTRPLKVTNNKAREDAAQREAD